MIGRRTDAGALHELVGRLKVRELARAGQRSVEALVEEVLREAGLDALGLLGAVADHGRACAEPALAELRLTNPAHDDPTAIVYRRQDDRLAIALDGAGGPRRFELHACVPRLGARARGPRPGVRGRHRGPGRCRVGGALRGQGLDLVAGLDP